MKKHQSLITACLLGCALLSGTASAATPGTVFEDTTGFGDWYKGATGANSGTLTKGADLAWVKGGAGLQETIGRSFTSQALTVGQTLRFTGDLTQSSASFTLFRVGLYDTANTLSADGRALGAIDGYYSFLRDSGGAVNTQNDARYSNGAAIPTDSGSTIFSGTNPANYDYALATTYQFTFDVTYTSLGQVDTLMTMMEGATERFSIAGSDTVGLANTFDGAFLRTAGGTATFDNLSVAVIPEPNAAALLAGLLGLTSVMIRRRRR